MRYRLTTLLAIIVALQALAQSNCIYIEDFEVCPDSVVTVPVMLANADETRGFQFNITMPQGLKVVGHRLAEYAIDYGMNLTFSKSENDDCYTAVVVPHDRTCFPPDTTAVMTLRLKASHDFKGGEISLWKERGSTVENKTIFMSDSTTIVTVPESVLVGIPIDMQQSEDLPF